MVRTYVPMYLCTYVPMYLCTYVPMYLCTYVPMGQVHTLYTMILTRCQFLALRYLVLRIDARNVPDHAPEMTLKHEQIAMRLNCN